MTAPRSSPWSAWATWACPFDCSSGLPLAAAFAEQGFPVAGIDVDHRKVAAPNRARD